MRRVDYSPSYGHYATKKRSIRQMRCSRCAGSLCLLDAWRVLAVSPWVMRMVQVLGTLRFLEVCLWMALNFGTGVGAEIVVVVDTDVIQDSRNRWFSTWWLMAK